MRSTIYLQNIHTVVVLGVPLSGFAEGDWMEVKVDGNAAERTKGGDGPAMNISTAQGGTITISLLPTSPAIGTLLALRNTQAIRPSLGSISLLTGVRETITAAGCAFGDLDSFATGGEKMSPRKFKFECQKISLDTTSVESIVGSVVGSLL